MRSVFDLVQPERVTAVVDVGSLPIDGEPPYTRMLEDGLCTVVGFDPQSDSRPTPPGVTQLPLAIGVGRDATLNVCAATGMSSLLKPDKRHIDALKGMGELAEITARHPVMLRALDDIAEVAHVDFLKIDAQGSEVDILASGVRKLRKAVAVMVEVSFLTLYQRQWHFGHIDTWLREAGFVPHCFAAAKLWAIATKTDVPRLVPHQLLEADIVYVRDFTNPMPVEQWKQLAMIAHHILGSHDLAMKAIEECAASDAVAIEAPQIYRQILETM